ncbi:MAG: hypothetical protein OIF47_10060 [Marinibacterium sp.]|nr:hypothetical protein [Marinibacterium sp.]
MAQTSTISTRLTADARAEAQIQPLSDRFCQRLARAAQDYAPITAPVRVLDLGDATLRRALTDGTDKPCRVDLLCPHAPTDSANSADVTVIPGTLGQADLDGALYDRVLCAHAIDPRSDPQSALAWLFDRLKPGGVALFVMSRPRWSGALLQRRLGKPVLCENGVTELLDRVGFVDILCCAQKKDPGRGKSCGYLARKPNGL